MTTALRSPLRWQVSSSRQKCSMSSAACGRLRHLQAVATWASAHVPSLGAFVGSRLASTSQLLCSPPPPSSHFTCQRCESILQVGINCSVRVRSRKKKKRSSVSKEVSPPVNRILCYCHFCGFENVKLGTPKDYVKTKLSEVAARHRLSELSKGLRGKITKRSENELIPTTKVLATESAGSSGKKTKRKGWLSLKHLAASSADLSPIGSRAVFMRSTISTPTPQVNHLDSSKSMPKFSQVDSKNVAPVSSIKGQHSSDVNSKKTNLELEQCITFAGVATGKDAIRSSSSISRRRSASIFGMPEDGVALKASQSPLRTKKGVLTSAIDLAGNSSIAKPARLLCTLQDGLNKLEKESNKGGISLTKKRELDRDRHKAAKKQKPMAPSDVDGDLDTRSPKITCHFATEKEKKKPLFRKIGRHWYTKCRTRRIKWRIL